MSRDSIGHTLIVAVVLCVACSLLVSGAAVGLKPRQMLNKERNSQKKILELTGLYDPEVPIAESFKSIETQVVNLDTGEYVSDIDPNAFDQRRAARDPALSESIPSGEDVAGIVRRENDSIVYLVNKSGKLDQIVMPVRGTGLWSTMYGYLALDHDGTTVRGITFYEHGETPGLGGEIDNSKWQASWIGKHIFDQGGELKINVIKGMVDTAKPNAEYEIDGISGATITANGVTNMIHYWMGPKGFGPYLHRLQEEGVVQ